MAHPSQGIRMVRTQRSRWMRAHWYAGLHERGQRVGAQAPRRAKARSLMTSAWSWFDKVKESEE
jgi:hypothetical protein